MLMKWFRKKKNFRMVMIVTAALVIPGFVIWGVSISGSDRKYTVAVVNKEPIYQQEFYRTLEETRQQYREILKENYSKLIDETQLEKMVLQRMIQEKLLDQLCRKHRIKVRPSEIMEVIKAEPAFKNEKGQFDQARFKAYFSRISPEKTKEIEQQIRSGIKYQKLKQEVLSETTIIVSDSEIKALAGKDIKEEKIPEIKRYLQSQREEQYFQKWLEKKKNEAKIEVFLNFEQEKRS
ncbi:MAG: SurA N-terminal domain-containing protein [Candidatus Omnitrophica bacterium]|nr:SurA N-terminal domain-containing protein [Candidatus Omnitrophota bacterium]MCM8828905.1 SurA N-terminal domain-containing protein [Candidatus Omnitrophota bacterium]